MNADASTTIGRARKGTRTTRARKESASPQGQSGYARQARHAGRAKRSTQETFVFRGRGGARKGAGRKPKGARAGIPHRSRAEHVASHPIQMTTRLRAGLPNLRHAREFIVLRRAFEAASGGPGFRVIHHSIQSNHLHLIVEASDRSALSMGMRALLVRIARALNRLWERKGPVFSDRFHERALRTPREVRNSLVYVLQNARKHGIFDRGPDPYSSGPWFGGWDEDRGFREALERQRARIEAVLRTKGGGDRPPNAARQGIDSACLGIAPAATWLLRVGWKRGGLLGSTEWPRSAIR